MLKIVIFGGFLLANFLVSAVYLDTIKNVTRQLSPAEITEPDEDGLWSTLLEEWTLTNNPDTGRGARILQSSHYNQQQPYQQQPPRYQQPQPNYIQHNTYQHPAPNKFIPANNYYFSNRLDNAENIELMDPPKQNRPTNPPPKLTPTRNPNLQNLQNFTPIRQSGGYEQNNLIPSQREVTETDLFLLSAIEKLTYRVDYLEQRLKKTEQILYYMMEGEKIEKPACPKNFTKIGDSCYFFGTDRGLNWKSASAMCKSLGAQLAELDPKLRQKEVVLRLLNDFNIRGHDFWVGGLNPGLLWIWINSGKPVDPNTNLDTYSSRKSRILIPEENEVTPGTTTTTPASETTTTTETTTTSTSSEEVTTEAAREEKILLATTPSSKIVNKPPSKKPTKPNDESLEIKGNGRCLRLSYNPSTHTYGYYGIDCSMRSNYLCEFKNRDLENEISRVAKALYI